MGSRYLSDLADVVLDAGLSIVEQDGWETRARSSGGYDSGRPAVVMVHHTASNAAPADDAHYMSYGSDDRPIANLMLARDGTVWILAAGATNCNGKGGPIGTVPQDSMNTYAIAVEGCNDGIGEPWPTVQQDAYLTLVGALCRHYGIDEVYSHAEWAPTRKIDPAGPSRWPPINSSGTWDMDAFRADLGSQGGGDMPDKATFQAWIREVLNEGTGFGLTSWAQTSAQTLAVAQQTLNAVNALEGGAATMSDIPPVEPEPDEPDPD
jgi:N-acetylmuramoyl-L-alanine amidase